MRMGPMRRKGWFKERNGPNPGKALSMQLMQWRQMLRGAPGAKTLLRASPWAGTINQWQRMAAGFGAPLAPGGGIQE